MCIYIYISCHHAYTFAISRIELVLRERSWRGRIHLSEGPAMEKGQCLDVWDGFRSLFIH